MHSLAGSRRQADDTEQLLSLNQAYIDSVQNSDTRRFDDILAPDFFCSHPDGSLVDREQFLLQTARPVAITGLAAEDVLIRLFAGGRELSPEEEANADFAIIHARTTFIKPDGSAGAGRYTDVWAKRDGHWLAVSAHVTRL